MAEKLTYAAEESGDRPAGIYLLLPAADLAENMSPDDLRLIHACLEFGLKGCDSVDQAREFWEENLVLFNALRAQAPDKHQDLLTYIYKTWKTAAAARPKAGRNV